MNKLAISIGLLCAAGVSYAGTISHVDQAAFPGGVYRIIFTGADVVPTAALIQNPNSLILDFPKTQVGTGVSRDIKVAKNDIYNINLVQGGNETRVVINLAKTLPYKIQHENGNTVVIFSPAGKNTSVSTSTSTTPSTKTAFLPHQRVNFSGKSVPSAAPVKTPVAPAPIDQGVDLRPQFSTGASGDNFSITLPSTDTPVDVRQSGSTIHILLSGVQIPRSAQKRMDFSGYHSLVDYADVFRSARGAEIVLHMRRNSAFEFSNYQNGYQYTVNVTKPAVDNVMKQVNEIQGFGDKKYTGQRISLNFQDIEVRAVLQIIAEFTKTNIVVSDAVQGNITLRLDNVPWDQALDIILKTKGLGMRRNGSVIYVAPATELNQQELTALKTIQERSELIPARTELIPVKYANAADLAKIIMQSKSTGGSGNSVGSYFKDSILSSKGTVSVDTRTNTLLVSDIPSKLQAVRDLVAKLDEPVRQVLIDARLVVTTDNFVNNLGARFGTSFFHSGNPLVAGSTGSITSADGIAQGAASGGTVAAPLAQRLGVNFAVGGPAYGLAILGKDFLVDLELSALQQEGQGEIISSPRVVTQDGQSAHIASGQQIPYTSAGKDGSTNVQFKNAELSLTVTPRIAPDDRVDMSLDINKDSPNTALQSGGNIGIDTNQLHTNVLVDNGETVVLGGIYEQNQAVSVEKVPLLGDLPVVGNAFRRTNKKFNKNELVIFITPRIINNRLSDYDKFSNLRR